MVFVLIKEAGVPIAKEVYAGDDAKSMDFIAGRRLKEPDKEFVIYDDAQKLAFESLAVSTPRNENQKAWDKLKATATDSEKLFARLLDLD